MIQDHLWISIFYCISFRFSPLLGLGGFNSLMYFQSCRDIPFSSISKMFVDVAYLLTVNFFTFRSYFKRSLSDGNILHESRSPMSATNVKQEKFASSALPNQWEGEKAVLSESSPEILPSEIDISFSRFSCFTFGFLV